MPRAGGCPTGQAKITRGYKLPAKFVIHTVGPVWRGGDKGEDEFLRACYKNSLQLAEEHGVQTIAVPINQHGRLRFPDQGAARIAVSAVNQHLQKTKSLEKVVFVCFSNLIMKSTGKSSQSKNTTSIASLGSFSFFANSP